MPELITYVTKTAYSKPVNKNRMIPENYYSVYKL